MLIRYRHPQGPSLAMRFPTHQASDLDCLLHLLPRLFQAIINLLYSLPAHIYQLRVLHACSHHDMQNQHGHDIQEPVQ